MKLESLRQRTVSARCRVILPEEPSESDVPRPGALCRLAVKGEVQLLRVTEVSWPDLLRCPGELRVTLSDEEETASALLSGSGDEKLI